jgi:hypothetical protein
MSKYRVIKVVCGGEAHYEVQRRPFLFWITESIPYEDLSADSTIEFRSVSDANKYIERMKETRSIVKR